MSLPSTVTQRSQGNTYIANTGMEIAVQTGFAIRTGFYLTNSGNSTILMDLDYVSTKYDAFDFISGQNSPVAIPAGSTRLIGFDFYGLKDSSGPIGTGPDGTGAYTATLDLSFTSQQDGEKDQTYHGGSQPSGVIKMNITGFVTGYYQEATEFVPSHPSGFVVETGFYNQSGFPYQRMKWENPSTGYYFEKYKLQYSNDGTENWSDLETLGFTPVEFFSDIEAGNTINTFYYGTPTGLIGNDAYTGVDLNFSTSYYYRLRGEHFDSTNSSLLLSQSDWVYGYPVSDLNQDIAITDILTGLTSGSSTLPTGGNPYGVINCDVGARQALEIYLDNQETNVSLNSKFTAELAARGIDNTYFDSSTGNYAFTGIHFIVPEGYQIGSTDSSNAAIETGDVIEDSSSNEIKTLLVLKKDSIVAGRGGDGGDGGYVVIKDVSVDKTIVNYQNRFPEFQIDSNDTAVSTIGENGTPAIKITDTSISEFQIWADINAKIYGGGGGGGGGDTTFYPDVIMNFLSNSPSYFRIPNITKGFSQTEEGIRFGNINEDPSGPIIPVSDLRKGEDVSIISKQDLIGKMHGGVGGGGQGYSSQAGRSLGFESTKRLEVGKGNLNGFGFGSRYSFDLRVSAGGNGGEFGLNGQRPAEIVFSNMGVTDTSSFAGGTAGYAIDATNNTNYSKSNFRSNLFFLSKASNIEDIKGFLAHWDADDSSNIYASYSGTPATNGSVVDRWYPKNKEASIDPYILGGTTKPIYQTSSSYFNGNAYVRWSGTDMSASFQDIVGASPRLVSEMQGFEIFYNILPFDPTGTSQFNDQKNHLKSQHIFHKWSGNGEDGQFNSSFYSSKGRIIENAGLDSYASSFVDKHYTNNSLREPSASFVYNISGAEISTDVLSYKVFQSENLIFETIIRNKFFSFIDNPILGNFLSGSKNMSFAISDIVIFNRKLNKTERRAVNMSLAAKNRIIKTATTADLADEANRNTLNDENGLAGFIFLNS